MDDLPGGRGQRGPKVIRLSHQYAACSSCQLILPLYDDSDAAVGHHVGPDGRDELLSLQVARCGLCKRPLDTATPWPLDLQLRCPDCGALIRGPAEAAVLACPGCDSYFANPGNSPEVRQRVRGIVAEQARIAELVKDLNRRLEQVLAKAERQSAALSPLLQPCGYQLADPGGWSEICLLPVGHPGPHGLPGWPPPPRRERTRVPEEWMDHTRPPHWCLPMPSPWPWRAWTPRGSGWWPSFAMAWMAPLAVPSGSSARRSAVPRPGRVSCCGAP
jgi:hypothetical protein